MKKAVKAKAYTKEKIILWVLFVLIIGFIAGIVFILQLNNGEIHDDKIVAYQCEEGDILYLGDMVCGDEFGNNTYNPVEVYFDESDYLDNEAAFNVYDVIPLLLEDEKPSSLNKYEKFYIVKDTVFDVSASNEKKEINDFMKK